MCSKRFERSKANLMQSDIPTEMYRIYDNDLEDAYFVKSDEHEVKCLVDLLNGLYDENEQLRSLLKDAEEEIETLKKSNQKLMESLVEHEAED